MLKMTQAEMQQLVKQRLGEDEERGFRGLDMTCSKRDGKWGLVLTIDKSLSIQLKSQREQFRSFANLDSAHKVATSIINHMTVIGK